MNLSNNQTGSSCSAGGSRTGVVSAGVGSAGCRVGSGNVQNRVYLDKIFFDNEDLSCPIIAALTANAENFTQDLVIGGAVQQSGCGCGSGSCGGSGCGCGNAGGCGCSGGCGGNCSGGCSGGCGCRSCNTCSCCNFDINCSTKFTITNSCVVVNEIVLPQTRPLPASAVTVDGFPVSALYLQNGRYVADLSGIMPDITKCPCTPLDRHLCSGCGTCSPCNITCDNDGHFFLAEAGGPWEVSLTIVLEGTVSNGKQNCNFKLTLKTRNDVSGSFPITVTGSSNFAMYCVEIPCQTNGIAPSLVFDFNACGVLLNPTLEVESEATEGCADAVSVVLTSNLVLTPGIHLQVVRPTLFALQADEINTCCDDLGQCAGVESCGACSQNCECPSGQQNIGSSGQNRPQTQTSSGTCGSVRNTGSTCRCSGSANVGIRRLPSACQCCDTNGYLF